MPGTYHSQNVGALRIAAPETPSRGGESELFPPPAWVARGTRSDG